MFEDEHTVNDPSIWVKLDHDRETRSFAFVARQASSCGGFAMKFERSSYGNRVSNHVFNKWK